MKRLLAILFAGLAMLVVSPAASAHRGRWYWSATSAENALIESTLQWDDSTDDVYDATCIGEGPSIRHGGPRLFKHFRCYVSVFVEETAEDDGYWIRFHVLSRWNWDYQYLRG